MALYPLKNMLKDWILHNQHITGLKKNIKKKPSLVDYWGNHTKKAEKKAFLLALQFTNKRAQKKKVWNMQQKTLRRSL